MKQSEVELDRLRIWDFYLTFPNEARNIVFPLSLSDLKKIFKKKPDNPYEDLIDPKRIIERMRTYQVAALKCIVSYGLIDNQLFVKGIIKRTDKSIPDELVEMIEDISVERSNVLKLIFGFDELPLYGKTGLKSRTGLIEFKYDQR